MELDLTLVRHAEAAWEKGKPLADPPLTARGVGQAAHLAERATRWKKPTHLYVSPSLRAQETAEPLAAALGVAPEVAPWLREIELAHPARSAEGVAADAWAAFRAGATSGLAAALAALGVAPHASGAGDPPRIWTLGGGADARVILVGHGMAHAVLLEYLLGAPSVAWAGHRLQFGHAAFAGVRAFPWAEGAVFGLVRYNERDHLPRELRTF